MDPQQPTPVGNPYDYIINAPGPKKSSIFGGDQNKTLISVLFVLIVLFIAVALFVVFRSFTKKDYSAYIKATQQQSEIVRIADLGISKARTPSTKNYVQTIRTITASEQNQTLALLKVKGQKVTPKQLLLLKDSDTDKKLATAEQSSTYDDVLLATINQLVLEYEKTAKSATSSPVGNTEKALTATLATNAKVLANIK